MAERTKVTLPQLGAKVAKGEPITWLTCYDYPTAVMQDAAGIDMILVGDSLGMTMLGYDSTLPVTMDDMVRHTAAVRRGAPNAWLIGDMPYMSYQPSVETAIRNAGRLMAETGCDAVKLEGGSEMADRLEAIAKCGIPVMGHLGLTPQSAGALGGFRVQGSGAAQAKRIVDDARILEEAGAFSIILELVPDRLAGLVTAACTERDHHGPRIRPRRPRAAADLPRRLRAVPAFQAAHGQGLRRRRRRDPRRPRRLRARGDRPVLPAVRSTGSA